MDSWILDASDPDQLANSHTESSRRLLNEAIYKTTYLEDENLKNMADLYEIAVLDLLDDEAQLSTLRSVSDAAFQLTRVLSTPNNNLHAAKMYLRLCCFAVLADRGTDAVRFLKERQWPTLPMQSPTWGERTWSTILDIWLRLIRKDGWQDLDALLGNIKELRERQNDFESKYLDDLETSKTSAAWELIVLYHLAKAAEILALYTMQGAVQGRFDIREQLDSQFDRALIASSRGDFVELDSLTRLLRRTAKQLVDNCIWTVTRAVNSRVTQFVQNLVSRGQANPIFEMLPPQRHALREKGLLGSSHRSVVVSLPTSSGKTFIAEFRILQALNQFDKEGGWVAYLVPTRALVNQISVRLRRDFAPLGINVERVSPALEVDNQEIGLLTDQNDVTRFRVLVTTPEKLDLMLRGGWETRIGRPLTLVVVDEAHNLQQRVRGIKLELLLATINRECQYAQFLLLTPFIENASEIARWLAPDSYDNISLTIHWQPNDRAIVLSIPETDITADRFSINLETVHTSRNTLTVPERLELTNEHVLGFTWHDIKSSANKLAAATAQLLRNRGPVIILSQRPDWVWKLAGFFKENGAKSYINDNLQLVQRYLAKEYGDDFELRELLKYGVGIHHAGLSDETRALMEWLLENGDIDILVATTTIAQGVNFPVSNVVLAQNKYYQPSRRMTEEMPPEDFWNIAGRAGRVEQGSVGVIALAAKNEEKADELRQFINRSVSSLNSTLIEMVRKAISTSGRIDLQHLYYDPEWSAFLQYLAHTYRQIGDPDRFVHEIEQVMRGTLGFQNLKRINTTWANSLISAVIDYAEHLSGKPLVFVDSTGFSWESVSATLTKLSEERITKDIWDPKRLFGSDIGNLQKLMGVLLAVPELRENLKAATGGRIPGGDLLARMVRSWVNGSSLTEMAQEYFSEDARGNPVKPLDAITNCCKNLFGKLIQTASWGLSALQVLNIGDLLENLPEEEQRTIRNLPACVYYGVNTDEAIALRLLGVPRGAAQPLSNVLGTKTRSTPLSQLRNELTQSDQNIWIRALGQDGQDYYDVWKILEGIT
jgi:superfamily II DNA/RNA helicase